MRILVLADAEAWHTERYVLELRAQGHIVSLVSMQPGELVDCHLPQSKYGAAVSYISHVRRLKELIDEFHPDVVNAHFASAYGVMAARCRRRFGACGAYWAMTVWGSDILISPTKSYLHRRRVQYALQSADVILADSTFLRNKTEALTDSPVKVVHWGIERRYIADDALLIKRARRIGSHRQSRPLKLFAPRPHRAPYANESLLRSLAPMLINGDATVTVNTTGDLFERFKALAESLGVGNTVSVYQPCSRDDYIELLSEHDIYVSAATSDSSPVSLIEAMAVGVFPVSADHSGLTDLVSRDNVRYNCYGPDLGSEVSDVIKRVIGMDDSEREALLCGNRDLVLQKAVYEENIRETAALFEEGASRE